MKDSKITEVEDQIVEVYENNFKVAVEFLFHDKKISISEEIIEALERPKDQTQNSFMELCKNFSENCEKEKIPFALTDLKIFIYGKDDEPHCVWKKGFITFPPTSFQSYYKWAYIFFHELNHAWVPPSRLMEEENAEGLPFYFFTRLLFPNDPEAIKIATNQTYLSRHEGEQYLLKNPDFYWVHYKKNLELVRNLSPCRHRD